MMLGKKVILSDMESVDADFHRSLQWMLYFLLFIFYFSLVLYNNVIMIIIGTTTLPMCWT